MTSVHLYLGSDDLASPAQAEAAFAHVRGPRRRWWRSSIQVWLSGALARPFLWGPVAGLRGWTEAQQVAVAAAPDACGLTGPCAVWVESNPAQGATVVTALEESVVDLLEAAASAAGVRMASIRPAWALATADLSRTTTGDALLVCREGDATTLLGWQQDRPTFAATYAPVPRAPELEALVRRVQASLNIGEASVHDLTIGDAADRRASPRLVRATQATDA